MKLKTTGAVRSKLRAGELHGRGKPVRWKSIIERVLKILPAASFQLPRQISHSPRLVFTLFQIVFSLFPRLSFSRTHGEQGWKRWTRQLPAEMLVSGGRLIAISRHFILRGVAKHPPFSSRVVLPAGWECGKSCENFFVNSGKVEDDSKERPARRQK